jgi:2-C-methyl-D-erythritol 4-phosphate cytidylyltransferase
MMIANEWRKVKKILVGGKERYESSRVAIGAYAGQPDSNLIFHDAVRPLVSRRIIDDVIKALRTHNAVGVAVPVVDTIVEVNSNKHFIEQIFTRDLVYKEQTPQGFKLAIIEAAYERALQDPAFASTDDCGVVVKYLPREKVYVVCGEETNIKLTYKEDVYLMEKLFQTRI